MIDKKAREQIEEISMDIGFSKFQDRDYPYSGRFSPDRGIQRQVNDIRTKLDMLIDYLELECVKKEPLEIRKNGKSTQQPLESKPPRPQVMTGN